MTTLAEAPFIVQPAPEQLTPLDVAEFSYHSPHSEAMFIADALHRYREELSSLYPSTVVERTIGAADLRRALLVERSVPERYPEELDVPAELNGPTDSQAGDTQGSEDIHEVSIVNGDTQVIFENLPFVVKLLESHPDLEQTIAGRPRLARALSLDPGAGQLLADHLELTDVIQEDMELAEWVIGRRRWRGTTKPFTIEQDAIVRRALMMTILDKKMLDHEVSKLTERRDRGLISQLQYASEVREAKARDKIHKREAGHLLLSRYLINGIELNQEEQRLRREHVPFDSDSTGSMLVVRPESPGSTNLDIDNISGRRRQHAFIARHARVEVPAARRPVAHAARRAARNVFHRPKHRAPS